LTIRLLLQPSLSGVAVSLLVSARIRVENFSTFCDIVMVQCVKLILSKLLHLWLLLFDTIIARLTIIS